MPTAKIEKVEAKWQSFERQVLGHATPDERVMHRASFYAGALVAADQAADKELQVALTAAFTALMLANNVRPLRRPS